MRKTILLHVGQGKTGSSAIQAMLARNVDRLARLGIAYPDHPTLALAREGKVSSGNIDAGPDWVDQVDRIAGQTSAEVVLFSDELLFPQLPSQAAALRSIASEHDVHVIALLRDPLDLAMSEYGQKVKRGGETRALDHCLDDDKTLATVRDVLRYLAGSGMAFRLRNYSVIAPRLLPEFATLIGVNPEALDLTLPHATVNRSLTRSELALQRAFNTHFGKASSAFVSDALVNACPDIPAEKPPLSREAYDHYLSRTSDLIGEINRFLPPSDALKIAPYDPEWASPEDPQLTFSNRQIDTLAAAISGRMSGHSASIATLTREAEQARHELAALTGTLDEMRTILRTYRRRPQKALLDWLRYQGARLAAPVAALFSANAARRLKSSSEKRDPRRF